MNQSGVCVKKASDTFVSHALELEIMIIKCISWAFLKTSVFAVFMYFFSGIKNLIYYELSCLLIEISIKYIILYSTVRGKNLKLRHFVL